jgi:hypothetical protein
MFVFLLVATGVLVLATIGVYWTEKLMPRGT